MKAIIIGCPGSGKSTFARKLHMKTSVLLHHLDMLWWNSDKTTVSADVFDAKLQEIISDENWIIDGNYSRTLEMRLHACDMVFFFDLPIEECIEGIYKRIGTRREDLPWVEERVDEEFLEFVKSFKSEGREQIISLLDKYRHVKLITFKSYEEADEYLQ